MANGPEYHQLKIDGTLIPSSVCCDHGVNLQGCKLVRRIPDGMPRMSFLNVMGCDNLEALPADIRAGAIMADDFLIYDGKLCILVDMPETVRAAMVGRRVCDGFAHYLLRGTSFWRKTMTLGQPDVTVDKLTARHPEDAVWYELKESVNA